MSSRLAFVDWCLQQEGKPYTWDAKGPNAYDCSGLVTAGLHAVGGPDWRDTHSAHVLANVLPRTDAPRPGDLCLYGSSDALVSHVMVYWGDGRVLGACGGGRDTTSAEIAARTGARVKFKRQATYRQSDFRGYASMPLTS